MRFEEHGAGVRPRHILPAAPAARFKDLLPEQENERLQRLVAELVKANQELRFQLATLEHMQS